MKKSKGLRWHGWVRTRNGHVHSYVRVRAWTIEEAIPRARRAAFKRYLKTASPREKVLTPHPLEDWIVIGLQLDSHDQNNIDDRKPR